jgi:hypothetical protein
LRAHSKKNALSRSPEIVFPIVSNYTSKKNGKETSSCREERKNHALATQPQAIKEAL